MSSMRMNRTGRSLTIAGVLLLSTALAAPAFAQIEEVVVTAQKKSEDVQTVPIAISAFTSQDLAAHQMTDFQDLQYAVPSVDYTKGQFGSADFSIRGIGSVAVATSGDSGVSLNLNDVYISSSGGTLQTGNYYDVHDIEVLRGPQSTLYGRNATGGAINIVTNVPDLDSFHADLEGTYGNYDFQQVRAMVNLPIVTDQLAVRVAAFWENRGGDITNIYNAVNGGGTGVDSKIDSRNDYSIRGAIRWQPTDRTTIDFTLQTGHEDDSRVRAQASRCTADPSGVLGCLPTSLDNDPVNANAELARTFASDIGPLGPSTLHPLGTPFELYQVSTTGGATPDPTITDPTRQALPSSLRSVNTDVNPVTDGNDLFASLQWKQNLTSWLDTTLLLGYDNNSGNTTEAYATEPGAPYADFAPTTIQLLTCPALSLSGCATQSRLTVAERIFTVLNPISGGTYFGGSHLGTIPLSGVKHNGTAGLNIVKWADHDSNYDQGSANTHEETAEWRFASNFNGPFNFLLGLYHLEYADMNAEYNVVSDGAFDFPGIILGPTYAADGYVLAPTLFDSDNRHYYLNSNAIFGEVYYNITDDLKFTGGLRYSNDHKNFMSKSTALDDPIPIGDTTTPSVNPNCPPPLGGDLLNVCNSQGYVLQNASFSAYTGHAVLDWTPKLDFTDQTLVYASYSRGYRSGGFNPPATVPGLYPTAFAPETIDAYELGTKNVLLDASLQANLTAWYYNYSGYQISTIINRTSINQNINSKLWGVEGEFFYAPTSNWQFNASFGYTNSNIQNTSLLDTQNPTQDDPSYTLLKDANGANCSIYNTSGGAAPTSTTFTGPYAGMIAPAATPTIPGVAAATGYLVYNADGGGLSCGSLATAQMAADAAHVQNPLLPTGYSYAAGVAKNISGNQMPSTPPWTVSFGVQYTFNLDGGYTLVPRYDYYWNASSFITVFNDAANKVEAYDNMNAQLQLNAPDNLWYARAWIKNIQNKANVTGGWVSDPSSGLFTNEFVSDPRTYGITLGAHF